MKNIIILSKGYISNKIVKFWSLKDYNLIQISKDEYDYTFIDDFIYIVKQYNLNTLLMLMGILVDQMLMVVKLTK